MHKSSNWCQLRSNKLQALHHHKQAFWWLWGRVRRWLQTTRLYRRYLKIDTLHLKFRATKCLSYQSNFKYIRGNSLSHFSRNTKFTHRGNVERNFFPVRQFEQLLSKFIKLREKCLQRKKVNQWFEPPWFEFEKSASVKCFINLLAIYARTRGNVTILFASEVNV
jgi:hypothetical protein